MSFTTKLRSTSKRMWAMLAVSTAVIAIPASLYAWGPSRPTYTIEHPADHVTFNSITNNPNIGDERNFVGIRENGTNGLWQDDQKVVSGKEYVVRMYVHNNAGANLGLVAKDVAASFNLPTTTAKSVQVQGFLRSSNAAPAEVYDHANFTADQDFNLAVVPGSIKYYNNANGAGFPISESVFTNAGAKLGYNKMDGNIPGCFQYAGYLTFVVKPQFAAAPNFTVGKLVSKHGENKWVENYTAQPGETVDYLLKYKNVGNTQQDKVTFRDKLPAHMTYVAESTVFGNSQTPNGVKASDNVTTQGINVGSYAAGANAWVIFSAKVAAAKDLACGVNILHNVVSVTPEGSNPKEDGADVTVTKECEQPKPVTACNLDTMKIEQNVDQKKIDNVHYTTDLSKCTPKPVTVEACNLNTKKVEQNVDKTKIDNVHYTTDLTKCAEKPAPKEITVCRLEDKKYPVTIKESDFDSSKYSKNPADCKAPVETPKCEIPGKENLPVDSPDCKETPKTPMCEVPGKETMPADSKDCKPAPAEVTELPHTGIADGIFSLIGLGSLVGVTTAYIASRRVQ